MNFTRKNIATHPELKQLRLGVVSLRYSAHALDRAEEKQISTEQILVNDKYGHVVELETVGNRVTKIVVRVSYSDSHDKVLVLVPITKTVYKVVTLWLNDKSDTHQTLNKERMTA